MCCSIPRLEAQWEKSWEAALQSVRQCEQRLQSFDQAKAQAVVPDLAGLANDLTAAWEAPGVTMRTRQQLLRTLIKDIVADLDDVTREVVLTSHWRGGQHSQVRVRVNDIPAYLSANKDGEWLTMSEAAAQLGVNHNHIRRLIKAVILAATQVVPRAPYQIRAAGAR